MAGRSFLNGIRVGLTGLLFGNGSSSDVTAITTGSNNDKLTVISGSPQFKTFAFVRSAPSDPTGVSSSTTQVMMGLAVSVTPSATGNLQIIITGNTDQAASQSANAGGCVIQGRYGTGSAPANAAADTGTAFGSNITDFFTTASGGVTVRRIPFTINDIISVTAGTTYWVDLIMGQAASNANASQLKNITVTIVEI